MDTNDVQGAYAKLPKVVQEYLYSPELTATVIALGQKHGLHLDVMGDIERDINLTLAGVLPLDEFTQSITDAVGDAAKAKLVVADINTQIFTKLRASQEAPAQAPARQEPAPVVKPTPAPVPTPPVAPTPTPMPVPVPVVAPAMPSAAQIAAAVKAALPQTNTVEVPLVLEAEPAKKGLFGNTITNSMARRVVPPIPPVPPPPGKAPLKDLLQRSAALAPEVPIAAPPMPAPLPVPPLPVPPPPAPAPVAVAAPRPPMVPIPIPPPPRAATPEPLRPALAVTPTISVMPRTEGEAAKIEVPKYTGIDPYREPA